ncbi:MAG: hypothetical protein J0M08_00005 [Bacteroidetes bacterium]|nr:hypothetical protein [Bacteroidota bacterium]
MKIKLSIFLCMTTLLVIHNSCKKDEYKNLDCSTINSSYKSDIKPIIDANCNSGGCHNSGSSYGDFTTYKGLLSKSNNGSLNRHVLVDKKMPPSKPLSLDDRKKIKCWINSGSLND